MRYYYCVTDKPAQRGTPRPCKVSQSPYYQPTGHCMHSRVPKQHPTCARDLGYTLIHTCASKRSHLSCIRHIQLLYLILSYICASVWPRMVTSGPGPSPACAIQSIQAVAAAAELIMVDENHLHAMRQAEHRKHVQRRHAQASSQSQRAALHVGAGSSHGRSMMPLSSSSHYVHSKHRQQEECQLPGALFIRLAYSWCSPAACTQDS